MIPKASTHRNRLPFVGKSMDTTISKKDLMTERKRQYVSVIHDKEDGKLILKQSINRRMRFGNGRKKDFNETPR